MAIPYLILTDADSNTYDFNNNFIITGKTVNTSIQMLEGAYSSGGRNVGDGFPRTSTITIAGMLSVGVLADFETAERAMKQACLKGGYLTLSNDTVSRRYTVIFAGMTETARRTEGQEKHLDQVHKTYSIRFALQSPFQEDITATDDDNVLAGDDTVTITNSGDFLVKPVITIDADQSVDIPEFTIINTTDGSMSFTYTDASFESGDSVVIDCAAGTVKRNGGDTKENFSGNFVRLLTGSNSIDYEGAACTLTFTFRKVYL